MNLYLTNKKYSDCLLSLEETQLPVDSIIDDKFKITQNLYNGVGGYVYMMENVTDQEGKAAQKPQQDAAITQAFERETSQYEEDSVKKQTPRYLLKLYQGKEESKLIQLYKQESILAQFLCRGNPHLVKYYGSGKLFDVEFNRTTFKFQEECYYIIFEYCSNNELFYYASNNVTYLDNKLCHMLIVQILQGIAYLHSRNVCHYDIKLENIMLDDNFNSKIIDFGLSGSNKVMSNDVKGTLGYIAPEFCKQYQKPVALKGEKVDVFALGVTLFSLYFGFIPFESTNYVDFEKSPLCSGSAEVLEKYLKEECTLTNEVLGQGNYCVDDNFIVLLSKMLNLDPTKRPEVSEILLTDPWVRGLILDQDDIEQKKQKLSAFLYQGCKIE